MNDTLETRLRSLRATTPPGLRERILAGAPVVERPGAPTPSRKPLLTATIAAAVLLVLGANLVALHLSPVYAAGIGETPWVVPQGQTVTADGHQVRLLGVDATPLETFVFTQIDGQPTDLAKGDPSALWVWQSTLTDQFGNTYDNDEMAAGTLVFAPLRGPSTLLGARMTLHITSVGHLPIGLVKPNGDWSFSFDITVRPLQPLPQVPKLSVPGATCTISDLEASGRYLSFTASYVGPGVKPVGPESPWPSFLQPTVETPSGDTVPQTLAPGAGFSVTDSTPPVATASWTGILPAPGTYRISCAPPASGASTTTIQVP